MNHTHIRRQRKNIEKRHKLKRERQFNLALGKYMQLRAIEHLEGLEKGDKQ